MQLCSERSMVKGNVAAKSQWLNTIEADTSQSMKQLKEAIQVKKKCGELAHINHRDSDIIKK